MPNRYEREIEEILRNLEHTEPKAGLGQKIGRRPGPRPKVTVRPRTPFPVQFTVTEWLLIVVVVAALLAGGYAYAQARTDLFSGIVALVAIVALILVALSHFIFRPRRTPPGRYNNVSQLRRNPFDTFRTRWNLFILKLRYRRRNDIR